MLMTKASQAFSKRISDQTALWFGLMHILYKKPPHDKHCLESMLKAGPIWVHQDFCCGIFPESDKTFPVYRQNGCKVYELCYKKDQRHFVQNLTRRRFFVLYLLIISLFFGPKMSSRQKNFPSPFPPRGKSWMEQRPSPKLLKPFHAPAFLKVYRLFSEAP